MVKNRTAHLVILLLLGLAACQTAQSNLSAVALSQTIPASGTLPSATGTKQPTLTNVFTRTLPLTPTATPTSFPMPDLTTAGPYIRIGNSRSTSAYLADITGKGLRTISLPEQRILSPDSKWYAYVTGKLGDNTGYSEEGIVLHVKNIFTEEIRDVANLVPEDAEKHIAEIKKEFDREFPPFNGGSGYFIPEISIEMCLDDGFQSAAWSPDGKYLAFTSIADGTSSTLYLYNLDSGNIQKVITSKYIISYLNWSPHGEWIHFQDTVPSDIYWPSTTWVVQRDGTQPITIDPTGLFFGIWAWVSDREFITCGCGDGLGCSNLTLHNAATGEQTLLWKRIFQDVVVDPKSRLLALVVSDTCSGDSDICVPMDDLGIYIGPADGKFIRVSAIMPFRIKPRGGKTHPFLGINDHQISGITSDGRIELLRKGSSPSYNISPSGWLAIYDNNGMSIFNPSDQLQFQINDFPVYSAVWDTNSNGVFFITDTNIYYSSLVSQAAELVMPCMNGCTPQTTLSMALSITIQMLPDIRAYPPYKEEPHDSRSIWSQEKFDDLLEPGTKEYSVTLPAYSEWRWDFSWCGADEENLSAILDPFTIRFLVGGEEIGEDIFRIYDTAKGGGFCRTWATLLSGWQPGDQTNLEIRYTLSKAVNDGRREYPAGEYRQIMHVTVTG